MSAAETPSLTVNLYASYLKQSNIPDTPLRMSTYNRFKDIFDKLYNHTNDNTFSPLTMREITLLGLQIKDDIIKNPVKAQIVSTELHQIAEKRKVRQSQRFTITRAFIYVSDCFSNYWDGFGFKPTETLIEELSQDLAKSNDTTKSVLVPMNFPAKSAPINIPPPKISSKGSGSFAKSTPESFSYEIENTPTPPHSVSPSSPESRPLLHSRSIKGKKRSLEAYKENPTKCSQILKNIIFKEMRYVHSVNPNELSVIELMEYISDLHPYDLNNELCGQVVLDTLKECSIHTNDLLCDWLIKDVSFNPQLLVKCFRILVEKDKSQKVNSQFIVESFFKVYSINSWNRFVPVNDKDIVEAMALLLKINPGSRTTEVMIDWMIRQPEFNFESSLALIRVFKEREDPYEKKDICFPVCDTLLAHFLKNLQWKEWLFSNPKLQDFAKYFRKKGFYASEEERILLESQKIVSQPAQTTLPKLGTSPSDQPKRQPLIRKNTTGKIRAIQTYKSSPQKCLQGAKSLIFNDIKFIEMPPAEELESDKFSSIVYLMKFMSDLSEIDLNNPMCTQITLDTFKLCNKVTATRLAEWLIDQSTFNVELLVNCLEILVEKDVLRMPVSYFAIEIFLRKYKKESWNLQNQQDELQFLVPKSLTIISALIVLLKDNPYNNNIAEFVLWLMDQPDFESSSFCSLLLIFRDKERKTNSKLTFPIREQMIARLHSTPTSAWAEELAKDHSKKAQETIDYICAC